MHLDGPFGISKNQGVVRMLLSLVFGQHFIYSQISDGPISVPPKSGCDGNCTQTLARARFRPHPDFQVPKTDHPNARHHANDAKTIIIIVTFQIIRFAVCGFGLQRCNSRFASLESDYNINGFQTIFNRPCTDTTRTRKLII